jgi:hypothetical protein
MAVGAKEVVERGTTDGARWAEGGAAAGGVRRGGAGRGASQRLGLEDEGRMIGMEVEDEGRLGDEGKKYNFLEESSRKLVWAANFLEVL